MQPYELLTGATLASAAGRVFKGLEVLHPSIFDEVDGFSAKEPRLALPPTPAEELLERSFSTTETLTSPQGLQ